MSARRPRAHARMTVIARLVSSIFVGGITLSAPLTASALNCTWNPATGNWSAAGDWSCAAVPGAADNATIAATRTVTINTSQSILNLTNNGSVNIDQFGLTLAAGGTTNKNLSTHSQRIVAAGKPAIEVRAFDTNADAIQALVSGQVDAAYLNDPQAAFYITTSNNRYKMAFKGFASNQLALATLKENTALADSLAWALERMRADGSYEAIMTKWGVASVPSFAYAK